MINPKMIFEMAKKWQKAASLGKMRKRISFPRNVGLGDKKYYKNPAAQKGHFVVYSFDKKRFVLPLRYLNHNIFKELFKMSEVEFGLPATGPITLPCDAVFMDCAISLVQQHAGEDLQIASFLSMVAKRRLLSSFNPQDQRSQQMSL